MIIDKNTDLAIFNHKDILDLLYTDRSAVLDTILGCKNDKDIENYNKNSNIFSYNKINIFTQGDNLTKENIDHVFQSEWLMPSEYYSIDLLEFLLGKCRNETEIQRCKYEYSIYKKKSLENLLRYMLYIKNIAVKNNVVLGVGRGSSVASFILFLIGIHKINSITYNLDFNEFLK